MYEIVYNIKNMVLVIIISEFLKNFISDKKYRKYISISVNLLIISYFATCISGVDFKFDIFEERSFLTEYENGIISEYEKNISNELVELFKKNKISSVLDVIASADEEYNIKTLEIYIENSAYNERKKIVSVLEGTGIEKYEIIESDNRKNEN